ncbi:hypothetical protein [Flavobacterium haoranii]|uniref:Quinol oxidase subunit 4 n=1 Tax=Flavobacterium haoranii TaxID=683124 RepID=A0A1M6EAK2_9FLAO|nr:hypothetical protein [Flavobacterium haoranii]MDK2772526.1 hypothetical protein [Flavobacterium sp.]SHI82481.1 hypothetical protein SAMN05444337_0894 [Flavobacterium haoranii]
MKKNILKKLLLALFALMLVVGLDSCHVHHRHGHKKSKPLPPGQMKKVTGSKSAKPYAPGQKKKRK